MNTRQAPRAPQRRGDRYDTIRHGIYAAIRHGVTEAARLELIETLAHLRELETRERRRAGLRLVRTVRRDAS